MKKKIFKYGILFLLVAGTCGAYLGVTHVQRDESQTLTLYGNVDIRQVQLSFRVFGQINALYLEEGSRVNAGDLVAELDKRLLEEALEKAKAELLVKQIVLENAQRIYHRKNELVDKHFASEESFYNAQADLEQAQADLALVKSGLDIAQTNLKYTSLYAPSNGVILSRIREVGTVLNPGDPVYTMVLDRPVWVCAYVEESDLGRIYHGQKLLAYSDSRPDQPYEGKIGFISPIAEFTPKFVHTPALRTQLVYRIHVVLEQPDHFLHLGMPMTLKVSPGL